MIHSRIGMAKLTAAATTAVDPAVTAAAKALRSAQGATAGTYGGKPAGSRFAMKSKKIGAP